MAGPSPPEAPDRAQDLPFADDSFDACVSHMALMLMGDVEQVIAEIARVLAPGATLACVIGGGAVGGEAYELFLGLLRAAIRDVPAAQRVPALGDRRTRSREGLDGLLGPAGFTPVDWETVAMDLSGPPEQVWAALSGVYDVGPLDPRTVTSLRETFLARAEALALALEIPDGLVPCGNEGPCRDSPPTVTRWRPGQVPLMGGHAGTPARSRTAAISSSGSAGLAAALEASSGTWSVSRSRWSGRRGSPAASWRVQTVG